MYKTKHHNKRSHNSDYDIYGDLAKIKDALADATQGVKGRAGEMLMQSFDDVKDKYSLAQEKCESLVLEKPFKSVGIALLAGVCLGYFIHK